MVDFGWRDGCGHSLFCLVAGWFMTVRDLPILNACLNSIATVLLIIGFVLIKQGKRSAHKRVMLSAFGVSCAFLVSYLIYHWQVGSVKFQGEGAVRTFYFVILVSHLILAIVIVPLVIITLSRALTERYDKHKKIARWTLPIWLYVSFTGVLVYLMLYVWFPGT